MAEYIMPDSKCTGCRAVNMYRVKLDQKYNS